MNNEEQDYEQSGLSRREFLHGMSGAGALLGMTGMAAADDTLRDLPGLLLLVPGAIALRGNVFGAMGSRLGTAVHAGTFRLGLHTEGVVGQNLMAAAALTLV